MFHRFHTSHEADRWQGALTPEEFEALLAYVGIENILSPQEWMFRLEHHCLNEQDMCITFDDGLRCQAEHALPVLERYGLRAFWFIYSCAFADAPVKSELYSYAAGQIGEMTDLVEDFLNRCPSDMKSQINSQRFAAYSRMMAEECPFYTVNDLKYRFLRADLKNRHTFERVMDCLIKERGVDVEQIARRLWLNDADLKALADAGHYIGLHSYDHPYDMAELSYEEQRRQYVINYRHIAMVTQQKSQAMAHPLNSYNDDTLAVLSQLGIRCGFRSNMLPITASGMDTAHLELAREDAATILSMMKETVPQYRGG